MKTRKGGGFRFIEVTMDPLKRRLVLVRDRETWEQFRRQIQKILVKEAGFNKNFKIIYRVAGKLLEESSENVEDEFTHDPIPIDITQVEIQPNCLSYTINWTVSGQKYIITLSPEFYDIGTTYRHLINQLKKQTNNKPISLIINRKQVTEESSAIDNEIENGDVIEVAGVQEDAIAFAMKNDRLNFQKVLKHQTEQTSPGFWFDPNFKPDKDDEPGSNFGGKRSSRRKTRRYKKNTRK
jgi:hypothetical protein